MQLTREILDKLPLSLRIEIEENISRKDFSQSERAALQEAILAEVRRHGEPGRRTDLETSGNNFPKVRKEPERATQTVGRIFGESGKQVQQRIAIVTAAKNNPGQLDASAGRSTA